MARNFLLAAVCVYSMAAEVHPNIATIHSSTDLEHPDFSPRLLYGETHGVSWSDLGLDYRLPPLASRVYVDVQGLDYHYHQRWLFYSGLGQIWRLSMSQEEGRADPKVLVVDAGGATSVAVDWLQDRVYWLSPATRTVRRTDLLGAGQEVVLETVNVSRTHDLVLDPHSRLMFVTLNMKDGGVLRAGLEDAAGTRVTVQPEGESLQEVVSLALDVRHRRLYISARHDYLPVIVSCDYGGSAVRRHDLSSQWWHQVRSLGVLGGRLYWVYHDWPGAGPVVDSVWKVDNSSGEWTMEYRAEGKLLDPNNRIWALKVYHPDVQGPPIVTDEWSSAVVKDNVTKGSTPNGSPRRSPDVLLYLLLLFTSYIPNQIRCYCRTP